MCPAQQWALCCQSGEDVGREQHKMVLLTALCKAKWRAQCKHSPLLHSQTQFNALPLAGFYWDPSGGDVNHVSAPSPLPPEQVGKDSTSTATSLGQSRWGSRKQWLAPSSRGEGGGAGCRRGGLGSWVGSQRFVPSLEAAPKARISISSVPQPPQKSLRFKRMVNNLRSIQQLVNNSTSDSSFLTLCLYSSLLISAPGPCWVGGGSGGWHERMVWLCRITPGEGELQLSKINGTEDLLHLPFVCITRFQDALNEKKKAKFLRSYAS